MRPCVSNDQLNQVDEVDYVNTQQNQERLHHNQESNQESFSNDSTPPNLTPLSGQLHQVCSIEHICEHPFWVVIH